MAEMKDDRGYGQEWRGPVRSCDCDNRPIVSFRISNANAQATNQVGTASGM